MKKHRRLEITAFRHRITVVSRNSPAESAEVRRDDSDSSESIITDSTEGRKILTEAVRLLEEQLCKPNV